MKSHHPPSRNPAWLILAIMLLVPGPAFAQETKPFSLPPGWVPPTSIGLFAEPQLLRKLANASDGSLTGERDPQDGPYAELGHMISGSGWLSAGPGYRHHVLGGAALVDLSAAVSTNLYKMAQGRIGWPHVAHDRLALGAQVIYRDMVQVNYFGVGPDSLEADREAKKIEAEAVEEAAVAAMHHDALVRLVRSLVVRLEKLEAVANAFPGVDKSYALQAGREIRIFVQPNTVTDDEAMQLARNISKKIEQELQYPGQIKVIVVREMRAVEYAK